MTYDRSSDYEQRRWWQGFDEGGFTSRFSEYPERSTSTRIVTLHERVVSDLPSCCTSL